MQWVGEGWFGDYDWLEDVELLERRAHSLNKCLARSRGWGPSGNLELKLRSHGRGAHRITVDCTRKPLEIKTVVHTSYVRCSGERCPGSCHNNTAQFSCSWEAVTVESVGERQTAGRGAGFACCNPRKLLMRVPQRGQTILTQLPIINEPLPAIILQAARFPGTTAKRIPSTTRQEGESVFQVSARGAINERIEEDL